MTYPMYTDFGKSTKDFFTKGFKVGNFNFNMVSNPSKFIKSKTTGEHNLEKLETNGDFQYELAIPNLPGFVSTTKWSTLKTMKQEIALKDTLACGLVLAAEANVNIETSSIEGKVKPSYKHPKITFDGYISAGDSVGTTLGLALVSGFKNFAGGVQLEVDPSAANAIKKSNVAAAYVCGPYAFFTSLENAELMWGGLVYRYDPLLEFGFNGTYKSQPDGKALMGACMKYVIDCCTAFKLKLDTDLQLGIAFESKIRPNASITASTNIDINKLGAPGHKIGLSVDLDC